MNTKFKSKRKFFLMVPVAILFGLSAVVMWLWNAILPEVTNVSPISYWQAMGILVLSKILFGGFCGGNKCGHHHKKHNFFNKMKAMTPEEREEFKEVWRQRFHDRGFCKNEDSK